MVEIYLNGARHLLEIFHKAKIVFTAAPVFMRSAIDWRVSEESETKPLRETSRILLEVERFHPRKRRGHSPARRNLRAATFGAVEQIPKRHGDHDPNNDRFVNQVHRDNIASAIFLFVKPRGTDIGRTYNVVDDQPLLQSECYRLLAPEAESTSSAEGTRKCEQPRKRGDSNKRVSNTKLHQLGLDSGLSNIRRRNGKGVLPSFAEAVSTSH